MRARATESNLQDLPTALSRGSGDFAVARERARARRMPALQCVGGDAGITTASTRLTNDRRAFVLLLNDFD